MYTSGEEVRTVTLLKQFFYFYLEGHILNVQFQNYNAC